MIRPIELRQPGIRKLPSGEYASTDDIWAMFTAAYNGDLDRMKQLAANCPGLLACEFNYTLPMHFAVREGHADIVRYLIDNVGFDSAYRSYPFLESYLTIAQDHEHHEVASLILDIVSKQFPVAEGLDNFLKAAREGDVDFVKAELARNPKLATSSNDQGETGLHRATEGGHVDIMTALLDAGANPDAIRADGLRPINCAFRARGRTAQYAGMLAGLLLARGAAYNIYLAAVFGDDRYVEEALSRDSSLANFEDSSHHRPISAAARRNDLEMVKLFLKHGANPSLPENGAPLGEALWTAVYQRQHEMAKLLLEHGANPNTAPESSGSALFQARGDAELTKMLLDYGAEDKTSDVQEFQMTVGDNNLAKVEEMLKANPDLVKNDMAFWGEGILCGPVKNQQREMVEQLMRYGARVPDVTKWGKEYYFKHYNMAKMLMERGMNPNHMTWHHVTLLHDMAWKGFIDKATLLLDYGADIDPIDEEYRSTPLGMAARWGNRDMVKLLLGRGADPNKAGAPWATPLAWARKKGHADIEADLLKAGAGLEYRL
jgi:ankyrin repeat protein